VPRIPTYDAPQVESRALPGVRQSSVASPSLFGAGAEQEIATGRGLMQAGTGIAAAANLMQERENADLLFRAETALKDEYLAFEGDVRNNRHGQKAWGLTRDTEKFFADQEKKHSDILTNDVQRQLFNRSVSKLRQSAVGSLSAYEAGERRKSLEESANASIVGSINLAAANAAEWYAKPPAQVTQPAGEATTTIGPDGVPVSAVNAPVEVTATRDPITGLKRDILNRVQVLADINGWTPERKQFEEQKHLTNLHKQVIQNLTDKAPARAREYFEANKEEINGAEYDGITKVLKVGETKQAAFDFVEKELSPELSLEDRLTAARDRFKDEPEKRDAAIYEIKTRNAEGETARRQGEQQAGNVAWKVIAAGGGTSQIPAATWTAMSGTDQRHVLDYLDAKVRRGEAETKKDGKELLDDIDNLDKVERMIEQGDITDKSQLSRYDAFFSKGTLKTLRTKIDKRGVVSPTDIKREFEERKGAKVNVAKMSDADRAEWMAFQDYILANVKETKRPEDMGAWADRWFMSGYGKDNSIFTNDPDTYGEARVKGRKDFVIATPEAAQAGVDNALGILAKNGVPMPKDKKLARDEFYTTHVLEAERWAGAHGVQSTPELAAAYALLKQNKKPVTAGNLEYVMKQLKK
jgi:hypothetical protein